MPDQPRPTADQLARYAKEFNDSAALEHFGVKVSFPRADRVRVDLDPVQPHMLGGLGADAVNGGVLAAMFDLVIGCTPALLDPTRRNATVQLSMTFMKPSRGERLWAEAWIDQAGTSTVFASAELHDGTGQVTARCQGVVKLSRLPWASGTSPAVN